MTYDFAVIGGGIIGLATAHALIEHFHDAKIVLLEKEAEVAQHQSGRNSGVIHSGIYYKPGSLKAELCRRGSQSMYQFCAQYGIETEQCGKVIVACEEWEIPQLEKIYARGKENGLQIELLDGQEIGQFEPYVNCIAGIWVASTGIVDYSQVCATLARLFRSQGGEIRLDAQLKRVQVETQTQRLITSRSEQLQAHYVINCAGLHSDRVAQLWDIQLPAKIIPFRGEYFRLVPEKRGLVRNLIYPVPHPDFPFLGVHFTRHIDGNVHAGPNAVLSFSREGYRRRDVNPVDLAGVLSYLGFWKLTMRYVCEAWAETVRSFCKAVFVRSLQRMIPEIRAEDLVPHPSGVRAQAVDFQGHLVDDFLIISGSEGLSIHVLNAPSPAATCALEIGKTITERASDLTVGKGILPE